MKKTLWLALILLLVCVSAFFSCDSGDTPPTNNENNQQTTDNNNQNTESGERVILTFNGAKNFVLIEESNYVNSEFETVPVYGDPLMIIDTIGVVSSNSLSWSDNNVDYYLASNDMSTSEILTIANSLNVIEYLEK